MYSVDDEAAATVDRYRAAYDEADGAGEEQPDSYQNVVAWFERELARLGRLAWAAQHPLAPLSPEILIQEAKTGADQLHELFLGAYASLLDDEQRQQVIADFSTALAHD